MAMSPTSSDQRAPTTLDVNPFGPQMIVNPYPTYVRLREVGPVYLDPPGHWIVSRYADVQRVLRDPHFGREGIGETLQRVFGAGPIYESFTRWMLFLNPPDHTRLRTLVSKAFTPRASEKLRSTIQQIVDELIDPMQERGTFDLIAELAYPLPVTVICELLGVPREDRGRFNEWSAVIAEALDAFVTAPPDLVERANAGALGLTEYFRQLVATRRRQPGDDLLSALVAAEDQGDRLTEDELLATCVLIFFAGHETTVNLIGTGMLVLLRHPDQLAKLRSEPSLIQTAVEELLRFDGPVQRTGRVVQEDVELGGVALRRGDRISAYLGGANRDPDHFAEPDRLDITRTENQHLAFGGGIHYCVGAPLARVEAQLAINTLLRRFPNLTLPDAEPAWRQNALIRGLVALPLTS
jgi:pimeloyl-[acyl-carrier protein] synthase